ncbi:MAG: CHASE3 domain-containing protein [Myxococcaceae bacterium]|nr:CHASE3 domain-containing protein [Myxococcaceae bacterium]
MSMWTFGRKIGLGYGLAVALLAFVGLVSYRGVESLISTSRWVSHTHEVLEHLARAGALMREAESGQRGYIISGDEGYLAEYNEALGSIPANAKALRTLVSDNVRQTQSFDDVERLVAARLALMKTAVDVRKAQGVDAATKIISSGDGKRSMDDIRARLIAMEQEERRLLAQRAAESESTATGVHSTILFGTLLCLLVACITGYAITRSLTSQVGSAVQQVTSSSAELQAAANQQVSGAREQAQSMAEITTTISELLATSRQIADSSQRVSEVAVEMSTAARVGDTTLAKTQESVTAIRRQVDQIVAHMLELGKKSQQIGSVLDIVGELAEQTNILAINATIEAAGAGEAGQRFGVVADEIRKLADRVGGSTKEIRSLVEDVRAAVNTTVMATEGGSKAVEAGARQFGEVTAQFKQIGGLVITTTEAAREIELSTKQQATAVEQVNVAVANVAQAAKETEVSSNQTLQTSSQLTGLAKGLQQIVHAGA